ncbi:hypothetical protein JQ557_01035 [Bradyrhizobium sp. U87765 SZCCT0131]|uniref:hypothetical protein n=1 Tax=unclassified Bradyrhizobium TaxID=2631580 RepID=UPI001BA84ECE|nr:MULTISPECIES: hypothetical protein [unclassified Bradyrhizobium]MBR1216557.1 hypothetical protein [Bradyrhizobium sp. U87765 SZCCT0131]MBR1259687.1 hypothetical protein [Bradyrhizobium sp. U87765 SZCCT0134]MBR1305828.1 hypothetical protein [Bradyrhizobium sp. U87765 SZCCT0110]MBR1322195.1 hypothetical protein [Bradyrhizobium sp. U87765 SZCCT0109]MBR1350526.1 hypothetical protein [Bradyrhizobium sp. U87765 SZCCT0048]
MHSVAELQPVLPVGVAIVPCHLQDLLEAVEFASADGIFVAHGAFVCRGTGKVYWRIDGEAQLEELPVDLSDTAKYVAIPSRRALGLGRPLALEFAKKYIPGDVDDIRDMFGKKGGFRKFRALLERRSLTDRWHAFEMEALRDALRVWCERQGLAVVE